MATDTDIIEVRFKATADGAVVQAYDRIAAATVKTETAVKRMDAANDNAFKRMNDGAGKGVRALGVFANAARDAEPALGKFAATAAQAAGTITQFGMYMGTGGPWGIALAAGIGALSLLTSGLNENKIAADEARKSNEAFAKAQAEQAQKEADNRAAKDPYLAALAANRNAPMSADEIQALKYQDDFNRQLAAAGGDGAADKTFRTGDLGEGGGRRAARARFNTADIAAMQRGDANRARIAALNAPAADPLAAQEAAGTRAADATRAKLSAEFDAQNEHHQRLRELAVDTNAEYERLDQEAMERAQLVRQTAANAFGAVASAGGNALNKLAAGQKTSVKEFVGSIGQALVAQGTADVARAGAMFFDPLRAGFAPGLLAAAGVEIAVGMGMGAAGASGGGGGGGARAPHARRGESGGEFLDRTRAASPTTSRQGGGGGATIINQNFNTPTVIAVTDEDAARMQRAAREGARHGVRV